MGKSYFALSVYVSLGHLDNHIFNISVIDYNCCVRFFLSFYISFNETPEPYLMYGGIF